MKQFKQNYYFLLAWRIFFVMLLFSICRIGFFIANKDIYPNVTPGHFIHLATGGLRFDLTAILYTNILYILLSLLPFRFVYSKGFQRGLKILFCTTNIIILAVNIIDIGYFRFTMHRMSLAFFLEFENNDNLFNILSASLGSFWYLWLLWIAMGTALWFCYGKAVAPKKLNSSPKEYIVRTIILLISIVICVFGIRGKLGNARPLSIIDAGAYVSESVEAAVVLNTPFCIFFSSQQVLVEKVYFFEDEVALEKIYTPIHCPALQKEFKPYNVVIIILEGFTREFVGSLNRDIPNHVGYTPFLDSLIYNAHTYSHAFANGIGSVDAPASILGSIPQVKAHYSISPYSSNKIKGLGTILREKGYHTSFFHGADNGSMGFLSMTKLLGFEHYYGRTEYGNDRDYDGIWGIWDEPFLQYYAQKLTTFPEPFVSSVFTVSSHHPYRLPKEFATTYPAEMPDQLKCVRYTDHALQRFFETASKMPWFDNTLFVLTADHSLRQEGYKEYRNMQNYYAVPIIYYFPGKIQATIDTTITSQIDIFPTILGLLNYDKPYFTFGQNRLNDDEPFVINHNGDYLLLYEHYLLVFDGKKSKALYRWENRGFNGCGENLLDKLPEQQQKSEAFIKAFIQQYNNRLIDNKMTIDE